MTDYLCVASRDERRLSCFMDTLCITDVTEGNLTAIVLNTGMPHERAELIASSYEKEGFNVTVRKATLKNRVPYAQVMKMKLKHLEKRDLNEIGGLGDDDTVWLADDDYAMNPEWHNVSKKIFRENPSVNYLTLGKFPVSGLPVFSLSGINFHKVNSLMGGSIMCRFGRFKKDAEVFFSTYGLNNMFDQDFWKIVKDDIYMLADFSMIQHCNFGSHYGRTGHMYAVDYDPWRRF